MAAPRQMSANPVARSRVRSGVRHGRTNAEIEADLAELFPGISPSTVRTMAARERAAQRGVDTVMDHDKRKTVDLGTMLKCGKRTERIRARITITWTDPKTGESKTFGDTVEMNAKGRLADLLNEALDQVLASARDRGYTPTNVTSADTTGRARYRIEYLECI